MGSFIAFPPEVTTPLVTRSARLDSKVYSVHRALLLARLFGEKCDENRFVEGTRICTLGLEYPVSIVWFVLSPGWVQGFNSRVAPFLNPRTIEVPELGVI